MQQTNRKLTAVRMNRILAGMKPLYQMLKEWREAVGLTPAEAGRRCNLSTEHYWALENHPGRVPRIETLYKLAQGTGIAVERLATAAYMKPEGPAAPPDPAASDDPPFQIEAVPADSKSTWSRAGPSRKSRTATTS